MQGSKTQQGIMETRLNIWVWLRFREEKIKYSEEILGTNEIRKNFSPEILDEARNSLIPQSDFEWISENKRQIEWLRSYVEKNFDIDVNSLPSRLFGKFLIFAAIDICKLRFNEKLNAVRKMQTLWREYVKEDAVFEWFVKKEKISRCNAAWDWVTRHKADDLYGVSPFSTIDDLVVFYDRLGLSKAEKERDVLKIQRFWHQRESRSKDGDKKQYNFILSKKAVADLDKIAKKNNLKRPQMLEILIENEVNRGAFTRKVDV